MMTPIPSPIPAPYPPAKLPSPGDIIKWIKSIWNGIKSLGRVIGQKAPRNSDSSAEDILAIQAVFEDFKAQTEKECAKAEAAVRDQVTFYEEGLIFILNDKTDLMAKYGIRKERIERRIHKVQAELENYIGETVSKRVSLNDPDCERILRMMPGSQKEKAMNDFLSQVINQALDLYCKRYRNALEELFEDVNEDILDCIDRVGQQADRLSVQLKELDFENTMDKKREILLQAQCTAAAGDLVLGLLEV